MHLLFQNGKETCLKLSKCNQSLRKQKIVTYFPDKLSGWLFLEGNNWAKFVHVDEAYLKLHMLMLMKPITCTCNFDEINKRN